MKQGKRVSYPEVQRIFVFLYLSFKNFLKSCTLISGRLFLDKIIQNWAYLLDMLIVSSTSMKTLLGDAELLEKLFSYEYRVELQDLNGVG